LAGVQITSQDGGGRDKKWRDALFFLAGCKAIRMTNCTHHSGAKRVPEAVLTRRPVNLSKMVMGIFGCVLIFRRQHPKNKTQLKGEIGLFGGVVGSVLGQDQIICLAVPELYGHTSRDHYLAPKSATVIFPFNNDPLQILMQWGGVFPDYFTNLRAGGGMMKEFERRLDEDGRNITALDNSQTRRPEPRILRGGETDGLKVRPERSPAETAPRGKTGGTGASAPV
jgi:hypothetical protein